MTFQHNELECVLAAVCTILFKHQNSIQFLTLLIIMIVSFLQFVGLLVDENFLNSQVSGNVYSASRMI